MDSSSKKPLVINDLLSFLSCKIKDTPREKLLRNVKNYYPEKVVAEAQTMLLSNLPTKKSTRHGRRVKNPDVLVAIYDCFQLIPEEDLPVFVCRNLNNVPTIEDVDSINIKREVIESAFLEEEDTVHNDIKEEQKTMKTQIADIADVVKQIKDQLHHIVSKEESDSSNVFVSSNKLLSTNKRRRFSRTGSISKKTSNDSVSDNDNTSEFIPVKASLSKPTKNSLAYLQQLIDDEMNNEDPGEHSKENDSEDYEDNDSCDEEFLHIEERNDDEMSLCEVILKEDEPPQQFLHARTKRDTKSYLSQRANPEQSPQVIYIKNEGEDVVLHTNENLNFGEMEENSIEITATDMLDSYDEEMTNRIAVREGVIAVSQSTTDDPESSDILYFTCSICNLRSKDKSTFNGHKCLSKTIRKPRKARHGLLCSICDFETLETNVVDFNEHMLAHYELTPADGYDCILCVFKSKDFDEYRDHLNSHTWKKPYRCDSCDYKCTKELRFKNHMIRHMEWKGPNLFECIICGKVCGTRNTMEKHKQMHKRNFKYLCNFCKITFRHKSALSQHILLSHHRERTFVCSICNCLYDSQHSLNIHTKVHFKDSFFTCHVCDAKYRSKTSFRNHILSKHPDVKAFKCETCGEDFRFKHTLLIHRKKHENLMYGCPYCNKKFKCASYLKIHCAIHEGKKPFKCTHCRFESTSKADLKKHLQEHSNILLRCVKCDLETTSNDVFETHKCMQGIICKDEYIDQVMVEMEPVEESDL